MATQCANQLLNHQYLGDKMIELMDYIHRGGPIVYVLIVLNIIGFSIMLWKLVIFIYAKRKQQIYVNEVLHSIKHTTSSYENNLFQNALLKQVNRLETGLNTIKIIASIAPLIGLLGTVIGVLNSFDSISKAGLGDPTVFSTGISIALITTVAGLIVAIPHYIGYNYLIGMLDNFEHKIEEKVIAQL